MLFLFYLKKNKIFSHVEVVQLLLEHNADLNSKDNSGVSALMIASGNGLIYSLLMIFKFFKIFKYFKNK